MVRTAESSERERLRLRELELNFILLRARLQFQKEIHSRRAEYLKREIIKQVIRVEEVRPGPAVMKADVVGRIQRAVDRKLRMLEF